MKSDAFRDWATGQGGLNEASARSYLTYLKAIEDHLRIDIDEDWDRTRLQDATRRLNQDETLNPKTRLNYQSGLRKYEEFRSLTSA